MNLPDVVPAKAGMTRYRPGMTTEREEVTQGSADDVEESGGNVGMKRLLFTFNRL